MPPFGELRGNVHGSSMARWKARGRLPISANGAFFRQLSWLRHCERILVEIALLERGVGHFERKFQGEGSSTEAYVKRVAGYTCHEICSVVKLHKRS